MLRIRSPGGAPMPIGPPESLGSSLRTAGCPRHLPPVQPGSRFWANHVRIGVPERTRTHAPSARPLADWPRSWAFRTNRRIPVQFRKPARSQRARGRAHAAHLGRARVLATFQIGPTSLHRGLLRCCCERAPAAVGSWATTGAGVWWAISRACHRNNLA